MERRNPMAVTFRCHRISAGQRSIPPWRRSSEEASFPNKIPSTTICLSLASGWGHTGADGLPVSAWPQGKPTMSMMNSNFAMKSVLMMGAAAGMMMAAGGARAQSSGGYTFTPIDVPGALPNFSQQAVGINDSGQVVGVYVDVYASGRGGYEAGFVDTNGSFTTIKYPGAVDAAASGINNAGQIVGSAYSLFSGGTGFLDINGTFTGVNDPLGTNTTQPNAISNTGQIVGSYELLTGYSRGFSDVNGTYTTISVPGATATYAYGVNDAGVIVGDSFAQSGGTNVYSGFQYSNGTYTTIDIPGAADTYVLGINNLGQITGYSSLGAFVDTNGTVTTLQLNGNMLEAYAINDEGDVVGWNLSVGQMGFLATPNDVAPLPVTGGTLPGALVLLGWLGRRIAGRRVA